jgi:hypothetical protein
MIKNDIVNINSQCQVVFFPWTHNFVTEALTDQQLSDSSLLDVSKYLTSMSFTKSLGDATGNFSLTLPNDRDWKQILHPGVWGVVYMSQDDALTIPQDNDVPSLTALTLQQDKVRGILYIDRVAPSAHVGEERGEYDVEFIVSGRDFGVVYVENEIFFNRLLYEGKIQEAAAGQLRISGTRNTADLLNVLHEVFFSPDELGISLQGGANLQKDIPLQWMLPQNLFTILGLQTRNGQSYYGSIPRSQLLNFSPTLCSFPVDNPMTQINGKAWDRLKSFSIEPFHELFTETNDNGQPNLIFRYIPWKTTKNSATTLGKLDSYVKRMASEVAQVPIDSIDIIDFDIGEENHNRYNYFLTVIDSSLYSANDTVATLADITPQTGFPRIQSNSIKRYGLRLMYTTVNALFQLGSERADSDLLRLHNELMLEYWNNAVFMESGTIDIIGRNDVKVGKVLQVADYVPYNGGKVFYIEGYTDHFTVDDKGAGLWTQSLTVTRGFYPNFIGRRGEPYVDNGEFTGFK